MKPAAAAISTSALAPLAQPVFRMLWGAWLIANTCMWMNDVAAAWLMTSLTTSPVMVALVRRFKLAATAEEDQTPVHDLAPPVPGRPIAPDAGPVLVTIEYRIDPARGADGPPVVSRFIAEPLGEASA